ncbi:MAG: Panacea domain-containing protein [Dehalococcoidales bacterium]|nr:Panacea domain-containing protein [Dehalococcoidales bacterium]
MAIQFKFNKRKAIEVILYLIPKIKTADIYGLCKILYLADKISLEKSGRFLFGESYWALKEGATPSNVYDMLKDIVDSPIEAIQVKGNNVIALRKPNLDWLSKSDIKCLNKTIEIYGDVPNLKRRQDAHDEAWKKNWEKRGDKNSVPIPVEDIAKLLKDSDDIIKYLSNIEG